jgi:cell pole-organizing protein PopZ
MSSSPLKVEPVARMQEPSMEEILASIRKIISDDDTKTAPAPPAAKAPEPEPEPAPQGQDDIDALLEGFDAAEDETAQTDVLELTEDMVAPEPGGLTDEDIDFVEPASSYEPPPPEAARPEPTAMPVERAFQPLPPVQPPQPQLSFDERLISAATDSAISSAFGSLTHTILSQNARTLDDLVQDMLRPMLKAWLDDNLPSLVERLVRSEIERVSRGGR